MGIIAFVVSLVAFKGFCFTAGYTDRVSMYVSLGFLTVTGLCWVFIGILCFGLERIEVVPMHELSGLGLLIGVVVNIFIIIGPEGFGLIFMGLGARVLWQCWSGSWWTFAEAVRESEDEEYFKRAYGDKDKRKK